jgi:uncharacterized protein YndB with AHSA1/START domain
MLPIILAAIGIPVGAIIALAATKPNSFRVERKTRIGAPPERVFDLLDDFKAWRQWSPWEGIDPDLKREYSGAARGRGSVYAWEGNRKAGKGRMEITESVPGAKVLLSLEFLKPFKARNTTEFTLKGVDGGTDVTWAMYGPNAFVGKVFSVFMPMDKMVGKDFETGLANMKRAAESRG